MTEDASVNVDIPEDVVERIRALCLALPEVTVRVDQSLIAARSTAWSYEIRRHLAVSGIKYRQMSGSDTSAFCNHLITL
jgi:hypothetical protein